VGGEVLTQNDACGLAFERRGAGTQEARAGACAELRSEFLLELTKAIGQGFGEAVDA
jgi:hypothetical protein